jgi:hypothetical protein
MAAPRQMTANTLNALKGWPSQSAVDFHAKFNSAVTQPVLAGHVLSLNSSGEYTLGVGTAAVMPLFLFHNSDDPDVVNDGGDAAADDGVFIAISPTGEAMALPAVGAYELVSTAFVTATTYAINDHLKAATANGKLDVGVVYTDTIVGVVSRGKVDNGYGHDAIAFWPLYIPPTPS